MSEGPTPDARTREQTKAETENEKRFKRMRVNTKKDLSKFEKAFAQMPPLTHSIHGEPFDIEKSEAAKWLCSQPAVMQWVFDVAKNHGCIKFDQATQTWQGVNHEG